MDSPAMARNSSSSLLPLRLREARERAGLSQKALGIAAGIDEFSASARMNQYETGKHTPDYLTLKQIAKALKVSPAYFYAENTEIAEIILLSSSASKALKLKIIGTIKALQKSQN